MAKRTVQTSETLGLQASSLIDKELRQTLEIRSGEDAGTHTVYRTSCMAGLPGLAVIRLSAVLRGSLF